MDIQRADTVDNLVDEVVTQVLGVEMGRVAALTAGVDESQLTLPLDSAESVSRCLVEIDLELILVSKVDTSANTATVFSKGRGYRGTTAAAHEEGALVSIAPALPRSSVVRELNNEILGLYPALVAPVVEETTVVDGGWVPLDADGTEVLDVSYEISGEWARLRHWDAWSSAAPEAGADRALRCGLPTDTTVRVTVGTRPTPFFSTDDPFATCGLPDSAQQVVTLGAIRRLLPAFDSARLALAKVGDGQQATLGPASILGREVKTRYEEALATEVRSQKSRYPARVHFAN